MLLKVYLVFAGYHFYPCGGWRDLYRCCDNLEEAQLAKKKAKEEFYEWIQIINPDGDMIE